jgi:hypothetical protein
VTTKYNAEAIGDAAVMTSNADSIATNARTAKRIASMLLELLRKCAETRGENGWLSQSMVVI